MPRLSSEPYFRCLEHVERGLKAFFDRLTDWVGPALVFGGISLVAGVCCCLPGLLVQGPLSCGLFACALAAIRGLPFETNTLTRGWELAGRSIAAALWIYLVPTLVAFVIVGLPLAMGMGLLVHLGAVAKRDVLAVAPLGFLALWLQAGLLGIVVALAASWFHARAMFVLPLIADRGLPFKEAFRTSWSMTAERFWDVWALHLLAGLVVAMCGYLCAPLASVLGLPLYHCMVASAYEERSSKAIPKG